MIDINYEMLNKYIDKRVEEKFKSFVADINLKMESNNKKDWMSIEETSEYLGLSIKTIYTYSSQQHQDPIPYEKFGGKNRYYKKDLARWIEKRKLKTLCNSDIDSQIMTEALCPQVSKKTKK